MRFSQGHITHEPVDHSLGDVRNLTTRFLSRIVWAGSGGDFGTYWASCSACLRAANLPRSWLHLDARILGLGRRRWLLLGSRNVGGSTSWNAVDSRLLGMGRR